MSKSSSGDEGSIDPYLRKRFYTLHWFSYDPKFTPKAREEFRRREEEEAERIFRTSKTDSTIWKNGRL